MADVSDIAVISVTIFFMLAMAFGDDDDYDDDYDYGDDYDYDYGYDDDDGC